MLIHELWAVPPNKDYQVLIGAYDESDWQWAMKHAAKLEEKGYDNVEIIDSEDDEWDWLERGLGI